MASLIQRVANRLPPWLLRFHDIVLVEMNALDSKQIPVMKAFTSDRVTEKTEQELHELSPNTARNLRFLKHGCICAVAKSEGKVGAMAWGRPGPGSCIMDDTIRLGFRWELKDGEAWMHNGEALKEMRVSGIYLTAFRRLIEEFEARGVKRCYGYISPTNAESIRTHKRLGVREIATIQYVRFAGIGWYRWKSAARSGFTSTFKRSLRLSPADFRPS
jgi:hypothetical protein